ncbi:MAG: hypothetical protein EU544_06025, partial [Promethearchaeota archaeon]
DIASNRYTESWKVTVKNMYWNSKIQGYEVITENTYVDLFEKVENDKEIDVDPKTLDWFIYPTSFDPWSRKLYGKNGLLQRENFGTSWLGKRLSYLWEIRSKQDLFWPKTWKFSTPEIYLFAPQLLLDLYPPKHDYSQDLKAEVLPPPDPSQINAINSSLDNVISAIQGPPGTGKSQTIAALVEEYFTRNLKKKSGRIKILITSFSYAAIRVIIDKIRHGKDIHKNPTKTSKLQMIFLRSQHQEPIKSEKGYRGIDDLVRYGNTWKLNDESRSVTNQKPLDDSLEESFILFANAHQLYYLPERIRDENFAFDLICIDEASQLPVDYLMSSLQYIHKFDLEVVNPDLAKNSEVRISEKDEIANLAIKTEIDKELLTKLVIVGDYNQLPPVQPVDPPKNLEMILESVFGYYVKSHGIPNSQLKINYRSHQDIVGYTSLLDIYKDLKPSPKNATRTLNGTLNNIKVGWVKKVMDPKYVVASLIHNRKYEIGVSALESEMVVRIVRGYYEMLSPRNKKEEIEFWKDKVGVVAPHNAQGRLIIRKMYDQMKDTQLDSSELMNLLKSTIYSVEKFQGSDRDLIVSSIGISDRDQLSAESDFIYNLNRFNVLTSRAKSKVILVVSRVFLDYIPNERKVMEQAANIRRFAYEYCNIIEDLEILNENNTKEKIEFRYKS